jgi:kinesin family protein 4/21/27
MDISDETESDDYDVEETDDEWKESGKLRVRKRKSKSKHSEDFKYNLSNRLGGAHGEPASDICCSCSKSSTCKTTKCMCKAIGNSCGSSCSCLTTKCDNRASILNESHEPIQSGLPLITQGAELLQGALADRPAEANNDQGPRKPLSDIGNKQVHVTHYSSSSKKSKLLSYLKSLIIIN